jgi:hypothetical protein
LQIPHQLLLKITCGIKHLRVVQRGLAIFGQPRPAGLPIAKFFCDPSSR